MTITFKIFFMKPFFFSFVIAFYLSSLFHLSKAQTSLLTYATTNFNSLNANELAELQKYQSSANNSGFKLIQVAQISSVLNNGVLRIELQNEPISQVEYITKSIEFFSDSNYVWYGWVKNEDNTSSVIGTALLYMANNMLSGYFSSGEYFYSLESLSSQKIVLYRMNNGDIGPCSTQEGENEVSGTTNTVAPADCAAKVLVLLSEQALEEIGPNYVTKIRKQIGRANKNLINSKILQTEFKWILAGIEILPEEFSEEGTNVPELLQDLQRLLHPWVPSSYLIDLENEYEADVFLVFVNSSEMDLSTGSTSARTAGRFCMLWDSHLNDSRFVVEHELGHVAGAGHQSCTSLFPGINCISGQPVGHPPLPARAHTFRYPPVPVIGGQFNTTVYSDLMGGITLPIYSTPDVLFGNVPVGIAETANNALRIKNRACAIASYFPNFISSEFDVEIMGPNTLPSGNIAQFDSRVLGGSGTFSYSWHVSTLNSNGCQFSTGNCSLNAFLYDANNRLSEKVFVVKLIVSDLISGFTKTAFFTVEIPSNSIPRNSKESTSGNLVEIFTMPNPVKSGDEFFVFLNTSPESIYPQLKINLFNSYGKLIKEYNFSGIQGSQQLSFNSSGLTPGVYYLQAQAESLNLNSNSIIITN